MSLSELLYKYESNSSLQLFLKSINEKVNNYIEIICNDEGFIIKSTNLFNSILFSTSTEINLNNKLELQSTKCGCLHYYKNKECVHVVALYAASIYVLNQELYFKEYNDYCNKKLITKQKQIINLLSNDIKISNPYFGLIHLIPVIEEEEKEYTLSLKIGMDKEYVIKNISEFINMTENNINYSYGQKLEFTHSFECLDVTSKDFYSFLANICDEKTIKYISIRKSHLLRTLEIYKDQFIYYRSLEEAKPLARKVSEIDVVKICLDDESLHIAVPSGTKTLISGVNYSYFLSNDKILAYAYKNRLEGKIFEYLFKAGGKLLLDVDSDEFISGILPLIRNNIEIKENFYKKYPIPEITINSYLSYQNDLIILSPKIACKDKDRDSPYLKQLIQGYLETVEGLSFLKTKDKKFIISDLETKYRFLTSDISSLKSYGNVFFDEEMKSLKAKKSTKTRVNISYNVGLLDFSFENENLSLEEIQSMLNAYHQKKKFIKLKDNTILEIDEETVKEIDNFLEDFNISVKELNKPINKPLNYLLKLVNGVDTNLDIDDEIVRIIRHIQDYKKNAYLPTDDFKDKLRHYQLEGFKWLKSLAKYGFGGILADDMGLGKTLEILAFLASDEVKKPSIIVCPMSLVYNWENECDKWNYIYPVKLVIGSSEEREHIISKINKNEKVLYITSYDSLRRDISLYDVDFRFVIADEAQYIKNQFTQKSEAVKSLKSDINYALTGTPIENGLADLWSIFDFLMPGYLSTYGHFKSRYESLIIHDDDEALINLKKRVSPFILRRTKRDVLKDLPDKIEDYYYCKMETKQKEIYDAYVAKLKDDINNGGNNVLALLTRLRQICITPELLYQESFENTKINMAIDLIKSSIEANHRILVFSQFSQCFPILSKILDSMNIKHFILEGTTKAKDRIEMVEEFNKNSDIKVFIISLKAGGTGLNLIGADMVIHLDPWWNSSAEVQATDRAYRIGQTKDVTVIKLICKGTIEEKVVKLQLLKKDLANSIVVEDNNKSIKLTKKDILDLLD
ncbi:MAG: SNF2-related protein [Anaeroplasma sp.]